ncbi:pickpocket protein 28-like [Schistocerca americana]|uniref:pickpocket protein 28-like n=1 Tax=Schistocerca americana TaxID=7009 RepID=UPI001F4F672B|nr:pickpocket protein 28-like [Schistocerca americana]
MLSQLHHHIHRDQLIPMQIADMFLVVGGELHAQCIPPWLQCTMQSCLVCIDAFTAPPPIVQRPDPCQVDGRLLWGAACAVCAILAAVLSQLALDRYRHSPTITSVETTAFPIWNVPFPALTLCNNNKVYGPAADRFIENLTRATGVSRADALEALQQLPHLVNPVMAEGGRRAVRGAAALLSGYPAGALMRELMQPCEKLVVRCEWNGQPRRCADLVHAVPSMEGFCCGFNYRALLPELDPWVNPDEPMLRTAMAGPRSGVSLLMDCEAQHYVASLGGYYGVSVFVHDPQDYPETSVQQVLAQPGTEVSVVLDPRAIHSTRDVRRLPAEARRCWFDDEGETAHAPALLQVRSLSWADDYSHQTCISECRRNLLLALCHCAPFYYPREREGIRVCGLQDAACIEHHQGELARMRFHTSGGDHVGNGGRGRESSDPTASCVCLPQCSDKFYSATAEKVVLTPQLFNSSLVLKGQTSPNLTVLNAYFGDITCIKYQRTVYMTWDNLLATIGGILGLCLGGSLLSVVELAYYATLFPWLRRRPAPPASQKLHGRHLKSVAPCTCRVLPPAYGAAKGRLPFFF